ncbi:MAG: hypothetical protein WCI05_19085, partial [Myxococcales bacterium]
VPARDWYDAGQALVLDYLTRVRGMLESRGLREPGVMMFTNDSPFTIVATAISSQRNILVHDGRIKNQVGFAGLDTYPKQLPDTPGSTGGPLHNFPFQADYDTKLYATWNTIYTKDSDPDHRVAWGAELQGGFYSFPGGVRPNVAPEQTEQVLVKTIGHGLKGASFYVVRGGLNLDGSDYDFQAAIGTDGTLRPRYEVMQRWGALLKTYGDELARASEVEDPIAILQDISYAVPQAGTNDTHQLVYTNEYPAVYGWLAAAGYNPAVLDAKLAPSLQRYKMVVFLAPKMVDPETARLLTDYVAGGGMLVQLLDPGSFGLDGKADTNVTRLSSLFPVQSAGKWDWPGLPVTLRSGDVNSRIPGADGTMKTYWYQTYWEPLPGASSTPLLMERKAILGSDGAPVALRFDSTGAGPRVLIGAHVASIFNTDGYYSADDAELLAKRTFARYLAGVATIKPAVRATGLRELAWGRKVDDIVWIFVENDHADGTLEISIEDPSRLGLIAGRTYEVVDALRGTVLGIAAYADLVGSPLKVVLKQYAAAVLRLSPQ